VHVTAPDVCIAADNAIVERLVEHLLLGSIRQAPPEAEIVLKIETRGGGVLFSSEQYETVIPESLKGEMFKPFGDPAEVSPHDPGPGTDLALVARFAELHGGRAWTEDLPEGGSALKVYLPAA
jgi:signal transduction histidine kinase